MRRKGHSSNEPAATATIYGMTIAGFILLGLGIIAYLAAFGRGPGPTMGDDTIQASLFTLATFLMILGFVLLVVI